jgi:secreted trypsin-like serine protease
MRLVAVLSAIVSTSAFGITINDTTDPGYVTGNGNYTGVVKILFDVGAQSGFICTGSLINTTHILTAGHCVDGASNWQVTFETAIGTSTINVAGVDLHPMFGPRPAPVAQLDEYDMAVLTLTSAAPTGAEIYDVKFNFTGVTTASPIDIVGYGLGGNPTVNHLNTGVRRHAVNTIDFFINGFSDGVTTAPAPDLPFQMSHTFGAGPANHGLINGGDSGGPAFFGGDILGVASFGNLPRPCTPGSPGCPWAPGQDQFPPGTYFTGHATLFDAATISWLTPYTTPVPEPGFWAICGLGFAVVVIARKRVRRV